MASGNMNTRSPLGRPFAAHLTAVGLSNLADGVVGTGVPLLALALSRSPQDFGYISAAFSLPRLLFGLPGGVLVDRLDRRRTMIAGLLVRGILLSVVAILAHADAISVAVLVLFAFLWGTTEVAVDLAAGAQIPTLVARDQLPDANARLLGVEHVAGSFLGAPIAGLLVALGGFALFGAPALLIGAAAAALTVGLRGSYRAARPDEPTSIRTDMAAGLRFTWSHPILRAVLLAGGLWNTASAAFGAVIVLWMVGPGSAGGLTEPQWALLIVAFPMGAVIGSVFSPRLIEWAGEVPVMRWSWLLGAFLNLVPLLAPTPIAMAVTFCLLGALGVAGNAVTGSLRPRMAPAEMLGKVGGVSRVIMFGTMPAGALAAGFVGEAWGLPAVLVGVVAVMLAATALLWFTVTARSIAEHELPEESRAAEG